MTGLREAMTLMHNFPLPRRKRVEDGTRRRQGVGGVVPMRRPMSCCISMEAAI